MLVWRGDRVIMEFTMYFAGSQGEDFDQEMIEMGCDRLFSQLNDKKHISRHFELIENKPIKTLVDSGAYSVASSGKTVDIDKYVDYMETIGDKVTFFANLDVIPLSDEHQELLRCADEGFKNFEYIHTRSTYRNKLCAVYHEGEPFEVLERYVQFYKAHPEMHFIALGGVMDSSAPSTYEFCRSNCLYIKQQLPYVKIHLFGYTRLNDLQTIKCDSVDSTTWIKASIYGTIITPWGRLNVSERRAHEKDSIHNLPTDARNRVYKFINDLGFTVDDVKQDPKMRVKYNVKYLLNWCKNYKYAPLKFERKKLI